MRTSGSYSARPSASCACRATLTAWIEPPSSETCKLVHAMEEREPDAARPQRLVEGSEDDVAAARLHAPEDRAPGIRRTACPRERGPVPRRSAAVAGRRPRRRRRGRTSRARSASPRLSDRAPWLASHSLKSRSSMAAKPAGCSSNPSRMAPSQAGDHEVRDFGGPAAVVSPAQARGHVIAHALEVREHRCRTAARRAAARSRAGGSPPRRPPWPRSRLGAAPRPSRPAVMRRRSAAADPAGR